MNTRNYYLYVLIDPNVKIPKYIGISNNAERRFKEHLEDTSNTKKTRWIKSLKDVGQLPVLKVCKSTTDVKQVCEWERQAIAKYKDVYNLVNSTLGGEYYAVGRSIDVYDLDCNYLNTFSSMVEYCELNGLNTDNYSSISAVCQRKRNYAYRHVFRYSGDIITEEDKLRLKKSLDKHSYKHLIVTDIYGSILGEYDSVSNITKDGYGSESQIYSHLNHIEKFCSVCNKFIMENIEEYPIIIRNYLEHVNDHGGWITQYSLDGTYINRFPTMSAAIKSLGKTSLTAIKTCLERGDSSTKAYGYLWRYSLDKENIKPYNKAIKTKEAAKRRRKKVRQYDMDGNFIKEWESCAEVEAELHYSANSIRGAANGDKKSSHGYIWKYVNSAV